MQNQAETSDLLEKAPRKRKRRRRSCLGCLGWIFVWFVIAFILGMLTLIGSFLLFPPFHYETTARILLIGLDEPETKNAPRRSDSIILCASRLDGSGTTLLSVARDSRVRIPGRRGFNKINAAYALDGVALLQETLEQPDVLEADLPYYMVFDSNTVAKVIDAMGGIEVDVPCDMDYDDNWGNLHIHLKAGPQRLNGEQAKGYLRWRHNSDGRGGSNDFERATRQRELVGAMVKQMMTPGGILRAHWVYQAFKRNTIATNINFRQLMLLAWNARTRQSDSVPGISRPIGNASFVIADWAKGREKWRNAVK